MINTRNSKYLTDSNGKRLGVVIPIKEYQRIIKSLEGVETLQGVMEK